MCLARSGPMYDVIQPKQLLAHPPRQWRHALRLRLAAVCFVSGEAEPETVPLSLAALI
jgi:hypothetical protein